MRYEVVSIKTLEALSLRQSFVHNLSFGPGVLLDSHRKRILLRLMSQTVVSRVLSIARIIRSLIENT